MIIAKQKDFADILRMLEGSRRVFIVGCGECATATETGGAPQVLDMKRRLEAEGKEVVGTDVAHSVCQELDLKRLLRLHKEAVERTDVFLVLSCGAGAQSLRDATTARIVAGTDSLFLGNSLRRLDYEEKCSLCGECVIDRFGGVCPVARCSKGLLNGPCGGTDHGMCEVNPNKPCAWTMVYERLKQQGRLDDLKVIHPPKRWDQARRPGRAQWRPERSEESRRVHTRTSACTLPGADEGSDEGSGS
ncbi:MAG: 5,10-methylenetetrahydrofolate reductase [Gaiellales bacterium]|nr:5,10-methylenetetrahydrofolate reductase [Gaiellales bacterium]